MSSARVSKLSFALRAWSALHSRVRSKLRGITPKEIKIREAALVKKAAVEAAFKLLCESDPFKSSIETTTKSIGSTSTRFSEWGERLRDVLGLDFKIPTLQEGRINFTTFWS